MSEEQPEIPEQSQTHEPPQAQTPVQPPAQPQPQHGFSGKQVFAIIVGVFVLLAAGLAIGGAIGYRLGAIEGAQQALANQPAAQAPLPGRQAPQEQQTPRSFTMPFCRQLPALNPGGPYLGVTFQMITPEVAAQEGITGTTGALVRDVAKAADKRRPLPSRPINSNSLRCNSNRQHSIKRPAPALKTEGTPLNKSLGSLPGPCIATGSLSTSAAKA